MMYGNTSLAATDTPLQSQQVMGKQGNKRSSLREHHAPSLYESRKSQPASSPQSRSYSSSLNHAPTWPAVPPADAAAAEYMFAYAFPVYNSAAGKSTDANFRAVYRLTADLERKGSLQRPGCTS
jgi:hypothetical protein